MKVIEGLDKNLAEAERKLDDFEAKFNAIMNGRKVDEFYGIGNGYKAVKDFYKEAFGLTEKELK